MPFKKDKNKRSAYPHGQTDEYDYFTLKSSFLQK